MVDFSVNGFTYRSRRIPAMTGAILLKKLAALMAALAPAHFPATKDADGEPAVGLIDMIPRFAGALSNLPDADFKYVIEQCMLVTQRQRAGGTGYADVWNAAAGEAMFDDIDTGALLTIVGNVLVGELQPFLSGNPFGLSA